MNDTSPKIAQMVEDWHANLSGEPRMQIAAQMFETARTIVISSISKDLSIREQRLEYITPLYGDELPVAARNAYADYIEKKANS